LQSDLGEKSSEVETVRVEAVEVMNKSNKYKSMVEPELTNLNQRWDKLAHRLKVGSCDLLVVHCIVIQIEVSHRRYE